MAIKPKGKLEVVGMKIKQNAAAVYIDIFLKDDEGNIFKYHGSSFFFELEHCNELESLKD